MPTTNLELPDARNLARSGGGNGSGSGLIFESRREIKQALDMSRQISSGATIAARKTVTDGGGRESPAR